ncbi:hypothetical protein JCGZ_03754 [Jatropha curcas]|uniref:Aminotransferase-like plant mobile domain-containing protein n=1 Tax=Jatropha curcas TaxID=180498 RepID=A0A067JNL4_JATCU|nr:hypothetical protein JCGZ_03754 [Jatropha curcas]
MLNPSTGHLLSSDFECLVTFSARFDRLHRFPWNLKRHPQSSLGLVGFVGSSQFRKGILEARFDRPDRRWFCPSQLRNSTSLTGEEIPKQLRNTSSLLGGKIEIGFGDYAAELLRMQPRFPSAMRYALMERWNDCTHTFVFGFGEMTLTPVDYAAITGLRFTGPVPPLDARYQTATLGAQLVHSLLDVTTQTRYTVQGCMSYEMIFRFWAERIRTRLEAWRELQEEGRPAAPAYTREERDQAARSFLFYIISSQLLCTSQNKGDPAVLACLRDLGQVGSFDWATLGLAHLYHGLDVWTRGSGESNWLFIRPLEVWSYKYCIYPGGPSGDSPVESRRIPRYLAHCHVTCASGEDSEYWRSFLNDWELSDRTYPGREVAELHIRSRLLMRGYWADRYFLGERVFDTPIAPSQRRVPHAPPRHMCLLEGLTREDLELEYRGFSANDFLSAGDFPSYFASRMQARLPEVLEYTQELENGRLRRHQSRQSSAVSRLQAEVERLRTRLEVEGIPLDSSDEDEDGSSSDGARASPPPPTIAGPSRRSRVSSFVQSISDDLWQIPPMDQLAWLKYFKDLKSNHGFLSWLVTRFNPNTMVFRFEDTEVTPTYEEMCAVMDHYPEQDETLALPPGPRYNLVEIVALCPIYLPDDINVDQGLPLEPFLNKVLFADLDLLWIRACCFLLLNVYAMKNR